VLLRVRLTARDAVALALCVLTGGCSGSGASSSVLPAAAADRATQSVGRGAAATARTAQVALPVVGGYAATVALPAASAASLGEVATTTALTPPSAALDIAVLGTPNGAPTALMYATLAPASTLAFAQFPAVAVATPSTLETADRDFYLAVSDPTAAAPYGRTIGPATVANGTLSFAAAAPAATFRAGTSYVVALYSVKKAHGPQTTYVHTVVGNAIIARPAGGSGPSLTLAGAATGLNNPVSLDEDAGGTLYVLNRPPDGAASILAFAPGATGDVAPIRTLGGAAIANAVAIRVVRATGAIYFSSTVPASSAANASGGVGLIAPNASGPNVATQTLASTNFVRDLSVGADDRLYAYETYPRGGLGGGIRVYGTGLLGSIGTTPGGPWFLPDAQAVAASRTGHEICALRPAAILCYAESDLSGRGTITRTIAGAATGLSSQVGRLFFAVDDTLVAIAANGTTLRFAPHAAGDAAPIADTGSPYGAAGP